MDDSVENLLSWAQLELANKETSNETFQGVKSLHPTNKVGDQDDTENAAPIPGHHSKEVSPNEVVNNLPPRVRQGNIEIPEILSPSPTMQNDKSNGFETMGAEETSTYRVDERKRDDSTIAIQENATNANPYSMVEVPAETTLSKPAGEVLGEVPVSTSGGTDEAIPVDVHSSEEWLSNEAPLAIPNEGVQQKPPPVTFSSSDGFEGVPGLNSLPDEEQHIVHGSITSMQGGEVLEGALDNINSCDFQDTVFPVNTNKSSDISTVSLLDNLLEVPEILGTGEGSENLPSADPSASEEQIPCAAALAILDNEIPLVMNELEGDNPNSQINGRDLIVPDASDANQQDATEPAPENSPLLQPVTTLIEDVWVPLIQPLQDGSTQPSPSTSFHVEVTPVCTMENTSQLVESTVCQSNHQVSLIEPQTEPFRPTDSLSGCTLPDLPVADESEHDSIIEGRASNRHALMPMEPVENSGQLNQAGFQLETSIALHHQPTTTVDLRTHISDLRTTAGLFEIGHDNIRTTQRVVCQFTPQFSQDPLQNELLRIQKETHETVKCYEEKRLQLKLDCEKEIEEVVAQIRRKYEANMKESEAEFVLKKKELDANHSKVLMNKILAEAFRSKCMDLMASNTPGMHRDVSSSFAQHLLQASHPQQNMQRPSSALPSSASIPLSPSPHTYPIPTANLQQAPTSAPNWPTSLPAPPGLPPPIHGVHTSVLSSNTTRPPSHINSMSPTPQLRTAIRAPAPHLQPFRTSASISATCPPAFQHHNLGFSTTISPSISQLPPSPSVSPLTGPCNNNRVFEPEMSGGLLTSNPSLSASKLLRSAGTLAGVNMPTNLPPLPDLVPNINPQVGPGNSEQGNAVDSSGSMDVVCLSDDE